MKNFNPIHTILLLCLTLSVAAQTHTWTGNGGDDEFSNPNNWDALTVPDVNSDVLISGAVEVFVTGSQLINLLTLENNASLVVEGYLETLDVTLINALFEVDGEFTGNGIFSIDQDSYVAFSGGIINNAIMVNDGEIEITRPTTHDFNGVTIENNNLLKIFEANQVNFLNSSLMNAYLAVFDIESNGGFTQQNTFSVIDNQGLIRKSAMVGSPNGTFYIIMDMNNMGTIEIPEDETFLFLVASINFSNSSGGRIVGSGTLDITQNFTNDGVVSPGDFGTVGTLDITNNFQMEGNGIVEVDLMSTNPGEYDILSILGSPEMSGNFEVNVMQALNVGDAFPVIDWSFSGASCNFPQFVTSEFDGLTYTFETFCNANDVTLEVTEIILGNNDFSIDSTLFSAAPNPVTNSTIFQFSSEILKEENTSVKIYNTLGQLVFEETELSENYIFERGNLPAGMYYAQLISEEKMIGTASLVLE